MSNARPGAGCHYSFPILAPDEIVLCLQDLQVPYSVEQLKAPTPDGVRALLESLLELVTSTTREELSQPVFGAIDVLSYPELHEESIGILALIRGLQKLMNASGVSDFSLKDILQPEFPRMRKLLSAIINFAKFREDRLGPFQAITSKSDAINQRKIEAEKRNNALKSRIAALRAEKENRAPIVQGLRKEISEIESLSGELYSAQETSNSSIRAHKNRGADLAEQIKSLKQTVEYERSQNDQLKGMVVQSPEKLRRQIDDLNLQVEQEKGVVEGMEQVCRELSRRADGLQELETIVRGVLRDLDEAISSKDRVQEVKRANEEQRRRAQELENMHQVAESECAHLRRHIEYVQEKVSRVDKQAAEQLAAHEGLMSDLKAELQDAKRERDDISVDAQRNEAHIREIRQKCEKLQAENDRQAQQVASQFAKLDNAVEAYFRQMEEAMEASPP